MMSHHDYGLNPIGMRMLAMNSNNANGRNEVARKLSPRESRATPTPFVVLQIPCSMMGATQQALYWLAAHHAERTIREAYQRRQWLLASETHRWN
jgi:hypothetical protein